MRRAVGLVGLGAFVARRLRRGSRPDTHPARPDPANLDPANPDPAQAQSAAAVRRGAIELHRRATHRTLAGRSDRNVLDAELRHRDRPTSVIMARLGGIDAGEIAEGITAEVCRQAGERLRSIIRSDTGVHHLARQEFVVVVDGDRYVADAIARRIADAFTAPLSVGSADLVVRVDIGVAELTAGDEPADVVHRADLARLRAARSGGGVMLAPNGHRSRG